MAADKVKATVKATIAGKRGYSYFHQQRPGSILRAAMWIERTWSHVEEDGGKVIQAFITPEDD